MCFLQNILQQEGHLYQQVYAQWLVTDLRDLTMAILPDHLPDTAKTYLDQPYCLQV